MRDSICTPSVCRAALCSTNARRAVPAAAKTAAVLLVVLALLRRELSL